MDKIKFDYLNAAEKVRDKGDFVSALHYLFLQKNIRCDAAIELEIADTYGAMGIINEAIKYYLRAYSKDNECSDAVAGLAYNFKDIDEEAAYYYLNLLLSMGDEMDYDFDEEDDVEYSHPLEVHDKHDKNEVMDKAIELFENGNSEDAVKVLESIGKDDYQYCDAMLARASVEIDNGRFKQAMKIADEALKVDSRHVGLNILKVMAFDSLGDEDGVNKWLQKLDAIDTCDEDELPKVALCLVNFGAFEAAEKYILRKLELTPYDKLMLLALCSVRIHKGDKAGALLTANEVCTVYPDDIEVKELTDLVFEEKSFKLPEELFNIKKRFTREIKDIFLTETDVNSPENYRRIKWLLQGDNDLYLQSAVCAYVTCMPKYDSLMDETLLDPFAPTIVKKQILLRRVCDEKTKRIKFVVSNIYRSLKVRHPDVADNLKTAYYYVFIALAVTTVEFERKLNAALKKVSAKFDEAGDATKDLPSSGLAALLFFLTMGEHDKALDLFDCAKQAYDLVCQTLFPGGI